MARPSRSPRRIAVVSGGLLGLAALTAAGVAGPVQAAARAAAAVPETALLAAAGVIAPPPLPQGSPAFMVIVHHEGLLNGLIDDLP